MTYSAYWDDPLYDERAEQRAAYDDLYADEGIPSPAEYIDDPGARFAGAPDLPVDLFPPIEPSDDLPF